MPEAVYSQTISEYYGGSSSYSNFEEINNSGYSDYSHTGYSYYEGNSEIELESMSHVQALIDSGYTRQQAFEVVNGLSGTAYDDGQLILYIYTIYIKNVCICI